MERSDLSERLLNYAVRIVKLVESLPNTIIGRRIGDQLLRSGTSPGANYEEAQGAESHTDFTHKLQIALKEMRESNFWLRVLHRAEVLPPPRLDDLMDESNQLKKSFQNLSRPPKEKPKNKEKIKCRPFAFCLVRFAF